MKALEQLQADEQHAFKARLATWSAAPEAQPVADGGGDNALAGGSN